MSYLVKECRMGDTDEDNWVLQSRNGDPAAFESLIRKHQRMIHSLTFRMTGSMEDAEDLAQEALSAPNKSGRWHHHIMVGITSRL